VLSSCFSLNYVRCRVAPLACLVYLVVVLKANKLVYNFISNRVTILSKTKTPNYCTIASNSLCTKNYSEYGENTLIGGVPAMLIKENISRNWSNEKELLDKWLKI
jgi:hypothetical protein